MDGTLLGELMADAGLNGVDAWIFDLDNTLYPAESGLFPQVHARMHAYIGRLLRVDEQGAAAIRRKLYLEHGTTLRGLTVAHGVDPRDFLAFVHDVDLSVVSPDPGLVAAIRRLPGRRFVFTNADRAYAERVLSRIGFEGRDFDLIWDIEAAAWVPKPAERTYLDFLAQTGATPCRSAFFEDQARNLAVPAALGMRTVLVVPPDLDAIDIELAVQNRTAPQIGLRTQNLAGLLERLWRCSR